MDTRKTRARHVRHDAATLAANRPHPDHEPNGEEYEYRHLRSFMSFTKGLRHDPHSGLAASNELPETYRKALDAHHVAAFDAIPIGERDRVDEAPEPYRFHTDLNDPAEAGKHRRWESPTAGHVYDLEGPDAQAVTLPPAPRLNGGTAVDPGLGTELAAEMAEVYELALLRDVPFAALDGASADKVALDPTLVDKVTEAVDSLKMLPFYAAGGNEGRTRPNSDELGAANVFRGQTPGERIGPYLSQFLLVGNAPLGIGPVPGPDEGMPEQRSEAIEKDAAAADASEIDVKAAIVAAVEGGLVQYGALRIDLKVREATPKCDYMTHWDEWLDVQHGANVSDKQRYVGTNFRPITTLRDMCTYVHVDALYEAYLNACLWLLAVQAPLDPRFATRLGQSESTSGFALFGGPHILTLVTEVATRALKAVRFQKFNMHLRGRPEMLAARLAAYEEKAFPADIKHDIDPLVGPLHEELERIGTLGRIKSYNSGQNADTAPDGSPGPNATHLSGASGIHAKADLPLLPMAFPEGSPMHPSYGAGHATVAGACVTVLKAFFDENALLLKDRDTGEVFAARSTKRPDGKPDLQPYAYVPHPQGSGLVDLQPDTPLTVGHELNKLAANISIARDMAGVHYYTDYIESLRMGERIATGILREQALTYRDTDAFEFAFRTFDGKHCDIRPVEEGGPGFPPA